MKITLNFKNSKDIAEYHMNAEEIKKLTDDFDSYITTRTPRKGMYKCQSDDSSKSAMVFIDFDTISMIN